MADYRERVGVSHGQMKSLMRIYFHYIVITLGMILGFFLLQIILLTVVMHRFYGRPEYKKYSIRQIYEQLDSKEQAISGLQQSGAAFAMILDDQGNLTWSWQLPSDLAHPYTTSQIASFTRWYLNDYPVSVWGGQQGLLVIGYPRRSIWKYNIYQSMEDTESLLTFIVWSFYLTIIAAVLVFLVLGYQYYRKMQVIADAVGHLASGESIQLLESGIMREIAVTLNRTSDLLASQRNKLVQRDEARNQWISGVSHDIRTPLSLVMGYADMIERDKDIDENVRQKAASIRWQSIRIRSLIEDLNLTCKLEYDMQPLRLKPVILAAILRRAAAEILNTMEHPRLYDFSLIIEPDIEFYEMEADEQLLSRAFENILGNCVRHNENGCQIWVKAWIGEGYPRMQFCDNGRGLSPDICRYLNTGKTPDSEIHLMGLKLVKQIVEAHNGSICIDESGHGITIEFNDSFSDNKGF